MHRRKLLFKAHIYLRLYSPMERSMLQLHHPYVMAQSEVNKAQMGMKSSVAMICIRESRQLYCESSGLVDGWLDGCWNGGMLGWWGNDILY